MLCSKCGKEFSEHPATSRIDQKNICPMCGHREALDATVDAGVMTKEEAENILSVLEKNY